MPTTKTISTDEEVIYTPEDTLPAVPAAEVKQLRALNTNGESVNVTPDELAKTNVRPTRNYATLGSNTPITTTAQITVGDMNFPLINIGECLVFQGVINHAVGTKVQIKAVSPVASLGYRQEIILNGTGGDNEFKLFVPITTAALRDEARSVGIGFYVDPSAGGATTATIKECLIGIGNQSVDWFPAVGIDYSLLTEQAVPGEFWANRNGIGKKQVYTRTFVITTNPAGQGQLLMTGIDILIDTRISYNYPQTIMSGSTLELMYTYAIDTGSGGFYLTTLYPSFAGKATVVSIKYTKR